MVFFICISIIIFLLFFRFPFNFKICIKNTHIKITLYKFILFDNMDKKPKDKNKIHKKRKNTLNISLPEIKEIFEIISSNKFKPSVNYSLNFDLGLEDAYNLALIYGSLYNFSPILYKFLTIFFNIKNYDFIITPHFNEKVLHLKIKSIIYVSIANIIYIGINICFFLIRNKIKKTKLNKFKEA